MRKRVFIDTNVMLDLLGERKPFYEPIAKTAFNAPLLPVKLMTEKVRVEILPFPSSKLRYWVGSKTDAEKSETISIESA